jgi:hypothetical protein
LLDRAAQIVNSLFVRFEGVGGQKFLRSTAALPLRKFCMDFLDAPQSLLKNYVWGNSADPCSKFASLENAANFMQASGSVRSFMPAEIPHGDDPTDDAQTSHDIGVEHHL